jgi:hypothetical protein
MLSVLAGQRRQNSYKRWPWTNAQLDVKHIIWTDIVKQYTSKLLSKHEDVFPALAGLAREMHDAGMGRYVAGLWEKHLPYQLCWRACWDWRTNYGGSFHVRRPCHRHPKFLAPSFSWASRTGTVSFDSLDSRYRQCFQILTINCEPKSMDSPFGEISTEPPTFLRVTGPLAIAKVEGIAKGERRLGDVASLSEKDIEDCIYTLEISIAWRRISTREMMLCFDTPADRRGSLNTTVYCFALFARPNFGSIFLVLKNIEGVRNTFRRIGIANTLPEDWSKYAEKQEIVLI